jgi:hypothetical protein
MKRRFLAIIVAPLLLLNFVVVSWGDQALPKKKQTVLGL